MTNEPLHSEPPPSEHDAIEMPRPTVAPLVLSVGLVLLATGVVTSGAFLLVGGGLFFIGLCLWMGQLLPGRSHFHESRVAVSLRPVPIIGIPGRVELLRAGVPGYRIQMPEKVHPISAGIKGGILGGLVMPVPALAYGVLSGHGVWYPANLLAAMVVPGMDEMSVPELEQFRFGLVAVSIVIHAAMAIVLGMLYGVLMPTLPEIPKPLAWGALLAPMLWTGVSFILMAAVNPLLQNGIDWPWFIASQFLFGVVLASVVMTARGWHPVKAAVLGALCGGLLMPLPAMLWGYLSGRGIWYPVNILASMVVRGMDQLPVEELSAFHANWLFVAIGMHAFLSLGFGVMLGLLLSRLPQIPAPLTWGAMLLPMVWTAVSYGMMGVVNPLLAERVDWPWFIFSQIVFGLVAAVVVVRSEMVHIPPAGSGPDRPSENLGK